LLLGPPIRQGATAEWIPAGARLGSSPPSVKKRHRPLEFARVLNHEAIHVGPELPPRGIAVGLNRAAVGDSPNNSTRQGQRHLDDPLYARCSALEAIPWMRDGLRQHQQRLDLALSLLGEANARRGA